MKRKPADADFVNKLVHPPSYAVTFQKDVVTPSKNFFYWLGEALNISDREAVVRFNDFAFEIKKRLASEGRIVWDHVGTLVQGASGQVRLLPMDDIVIEDPVAAEKVIREHAEHTVLVGEQEKTSTEMTELLAPHIGEKSHWWIYALIAGILILAFLAWYFLQNGLDITSISNHQQPVIRQSETTYTILQ